MLNVFLYGMINMPNADLVVKFAAEFLGVGYFKKYWPNDGSAWNKHHINKNSPADMKYIINMCDKNFRDHAGMWFAQVFSLVFVMVLGFCDFDVGMCFMGLFSVLHGYPMLVQAYNRLLATENLKLLSSIMGQQVNQTDQYNIGAIMLVKCSGEMYWLEYGHLRLTPDTTLARCLDYRNWILGDFGNFVNECTGSVTFGEYIYVKNWCEMYTIYLKKP